MHVQEALSEPAPAAAAPTARQHVRGSSLMLAGRILALGMNFLVQVLTVRYLSKSDYGAYSYALTVANLASMAALLCLDKALARFLPLYHERRDYNRLWGTLVLAAGVSLTLGLGLFLFFQHFQGWLGGQLGRDPRAAALVLLLIALAPLDAFDSLLGNLFAVFARPREIFFPRHVMGPVFSLVVTAAFILNGGDVLFLAQGVVAAAAAATTLHLVLLAPVFREQGLVQHLDLRRIQVPFREVFGFAVPLLASDAVFLLRGLLAVVLLERMHTTVDVAAFQAVLPIARLNLVVFQSFLVLYMPTAARLLAREDHRGINDLYWNSALWIAVLSFPLLAVTFSLAQPLTVLLFGDRYAQSGLILALLAAGHYFNAALGFNGLTLQVFGKVRYIVVVDMVGAAAGVAINWVLIARYGALGAAAGTCAALVLQNLLYQAGLRLGGVRAVEWRYARAYAVIVLAAGGLLLFQQATGAPAYLGLPAAAAVSLLVILLNRDLLRVEDTFPELLRVPGARWLFPAAANA